MKIIDVNWCWLGFTVHLFGAMSAAFFSLALFVTRNEKERIRTSPHIDNNYNSNIFTLFFIWNLNINNKLSFI